jgi:hypothetical protein
MSKDEIDKEDSEDTIDVPVHQQEFNFTYVNSEDLNE